MKNIRNFYLQIFIFGGKIFSILEQTCFRNAYQIRQGITKTYLYNFDLLKPHFYILNMAFTGVYIIFLIYAKKKKIDCGTR